MKKNILRSLYVLLALCLTVCAASCGKEDEKTLPAGETASAENQTDAETEPAAPLKLGILQFDSDRAQNDAVAGFLEGLQAAGYEDGKNLTVTALCANGADGYTALAETLAESKPDLILALTDRCASALRTLTQDIPIVFVCEADPVADGLLDAVDAAKANLTGVYNPAPLKEQIELIREVCPQAKTVAVLSGGTANPNIAKAKAEIEAQGLKCVTAAAPSVADALEQMEALAEEADAVYIPDGDRTLAMSMATVVNAAAAQKLPVFAGNAAAVQNGALASCDTDYRALGKQAAGIAAGVLKAPDRLAAVKAAKPQAAAADPVRYVNAATAKTLGIEIPDKEGVPTVRYE